MEVAHLIEGLPVDSIPAGLNSDDPALFVPIENQLVIILVSHHGVLDHVAFAPALSGLRFDPLARC